VGREVKRVPLDFDWPLRMQWKGYMNPYTSQECRVCGGSGHNPETRKIEDTWYAHNGNPAERWCGKLTQDEVDALIARGRLLDLTSEWIRGKGWVPKNVTVTADMVNAWSRNGLGHDAINQWICVETRAKRLGVWGPCPVCGGDGQIWFSEKIKELDEAWYDNERYDPPTGEGWQVWEDVSEGSPISPVFATSDELVAWLIGEGYSAEAAKAFVGHGWAPSMIVASGKVMNGIEGTVVLDGDPDQQEQE
jgi:hypothetical protein